MSEFKSHYWVTFNQATETFGKSVKGLTATPAIFFGKGVDEDNDKTYRFSRVYNLFNIEQLGMTHLKLNIELHLWKILTNCLDQWALQ